MISLTATTNSCQQCGESRALLPPFEEFHRGKPRLVQLCRSCYDTYQGGDEPTAAQKKSVRSPQPQPEPHSLLHRLRLEQNLTQRQLSALSGVDCSNLRALENGKRHARQDTIERLAQALRVSPAELAYLKPSPQDLASHKLPRRKSNRGSDSNLRQIRIERGLTQAQLAQACGVRRNVVGDVELGKEVRAEDLAKIAAYLGLPVTELTGNEQTVQLSMLL